MVAFEVPHGPEARSGGGFSPFIEVQTFLLPWVCPPIVPLVLARSPGMVNEVVPGGPPGGHVGCWRECVGGTPHLQAGSAGEKVLAAASRLKSFSSWARGQPPPSKLPSPGEGAEPKKSFLHISWHLPPNSLPAQSCLGH